MTHHKLRNFSYRILWFEESIEKPLKIELYLFSNPPEVLQINSESDFETALNNFINGDRLIIIIGQIDSMIKI